MIFRSYCQKCRYMRDFKELRSLVYEKMREVKAQCACGEVKHCARALVSPPKPILGAKVSR